MVSGSHYKVPNHEAYASNTIEASGRQEFRKVFNHSSPNFLCLAIWVWCKKDYTGMAF